MDKKLRDIAYPIIKSQFDKLSPRYNMDMNGFYFGDSKGKTFLVYNRAIGIIVVYLEYFKLKYFGIDKGDYDYDMGNIFMDLVHEKLGEEYEFWAVKSHDVFYAYSDNFE